MFGMQDWAYDFTELDVEVLTARIEELVETEDELREKIGSRIDAVKAAAQHQFDWLTGFLRIQANVCTDDEDGTSSGSGRENNAA